MTEPVLWTIQEAAKATRFSVEFIRRSNCPRCFIPSNNVGGRPSVRFIPEEVMAWFKQHSTSQEQVA